MVLNNELHLPGETNTFLLNHLNDGVLTLHEGSGGATGGGGGGQGGKCPLCWRKYFGFAQH